MALRRELSGLPGVIVRARPSGGQQMRGMPGGNQGSDGSRFSVEIRGHDLDVSKRLAQDVKTLLDSTPGHRRLARRPRRGPSRNRRARRPRQGGHPRHVRDRRRQHDSHEPGRHAGGDVPRGAATNTRSWSGCARRTAARSGVGWRRAAEHPAGPGAAGARTSWSPSASRARCRSIARTRSAFSA